ncbi:RNA 2'-phosphotransferase [Massilia sp. UYP32]|uniref:RNA 2'-phosphotransferase n=1 Tax=Massilia sp. UYP32 TaxID=1756386 RepID=UPI003D203DB6
MRKAHGGPRSNSDEGQCIRSCYAIPGSRRDVHLSATQETAEAVGGPRGAPVIITIETRPLVRDGFEFHQVGNGVWLSRTCRPSIYVSQCEQSHKCRLKPNVQRQVNPMQKCPNRTLLRLASLSAP